MAGAKNILELTNIEAKSFLLKAKSYCSLELPPYFNFQVLIDKVSKKIGNKENCKFFAGGKLPNNCENVNHKILNNKMFLYEFTKINI